MASASPTGKEIAQTWRARKTPQKRYSARSIAEVLTMTILEEALGTCHSAIERSFLAEFTPMIGVAIEAAG